MRWNWYVMYSSQNLLPGRGGNSANRKWRDYIIGVGTSICFSPPKGLACGPKVRCGEGHDKKWGPSTAILATTIIVSIISTLIQMNGNKAMLPREIAEANPE